MRNGAAAMAEVMIVRKNKITFAATTAAAAAVSGPHVYTYGEVGQFAIYIYISFFFKIKRRI